MKNTAVNSLQYTGIATLSQYIGSKKVEIAKFKNKGLALFDFLTDCLIGKFDTAKYKRPISIMLLERTEETVSGVTTYDYESRSAFIPITSAEKVYDPTKGIVRYSFTVYRDQIDKRSFNSIGLYCSAAVDDYKNNMSAVVYDPALQNGGTFNLDIASALVVDWELYIANAT